MTTEQDDKPRRRPPTIDLTATEIAPEAPDSAATAPSPTDKPAQTANGGDSTPDRRRSYAIGASVGALIVLVAGAALWWAGPGPTGEQRAAPAVAAPDNPALAGLSERLAKVETALAAPRSDPGATARLASAEAETKSLAEAVTAITRRIDDAVTAAREARTRADAAQSAAGDADQKAARAGQDRVERSELDALAARVAALERSVKALNEEPSRRTSVAASRAARLVVATSAMRTAVEHGDSYAGELAAARALGAEQDSLTALAGFAASGVPTTAALSRELTALIPAMRQTTGGASDKVGLLDRLQANAQKLIRVTPIDAVGDDPETVLARIGAAAAADDLAGALAAILKLPDASRAVAAEWVKKARTRESLVLAARKIANDALVELAKAGAQ